MSNVIDLDQFYTAKEAAAKLTENSGKTIKESYVRTLAKYGAIGKHPVSTRLTLYPKADIDAYVVESRGARGGRASRERARKKKEE